MLLYVSSPTRRLGPRPDRTYHGGDGGTGVDMGPGCSRGADTLPHLRWTGRGCSPGHGVVPPRLVGSGRIHRKGYCTSWPESEVPFTHTGVPCLWRNTPSRPTSPDSGDLRNESFSLTTPGEEGVSGPNLGRLRLLHRPDPDPPGRPLVSSGTRSRTGTPDVAGGVSSPSALQ